MDNTVYLWKVEKLFQENPIFGIIDGRKSVLNTEPLQFEQKIYQEQ